MRIPGLKFLRKSMGHLRDSVFPGGIILMYHRVTEYDCDPWGNCVSPACFKEQLEVINRLARTFRLGEMTDSLECGKVPGHGIALTFDDGYADNYQVARPLLEAQDTPATFFLVSGRIGSRTPYWWDDLAGILLQPSRIPESLEITLRGERHELHFGPAAIYSANDRQADHGIRVWAAKPGSRMNLYYRIWKLLRSLTRDERNIVLDEIRQWAGETPSRVAGQVTITGAEAHELAADGLIEIGSHSRFHPSLPDLDASRQRREIADSRTALEEIIGQPVRSFAYPYGDYGQETPGLLKEEGYARACTIIPRHVRRDDDPYLLPRFAVSDWNGDEFEKRFFKLLPF